MKKIGPTRKKTHSTGKRKMGKGLWYCRSPPTPIQLLYTTSSGAISKPVGKQRHFKARRELASSESDSIFSLCLYLFTLLNATVDILSSFHLFLLTAWLLQLKQGGFLKTLNWDIFSNHLSHTSPNPIGFLPDVSWQIESCQHCPNSLCCQNDAEPQCTICSGSPIAMKWRKWNKPFPPGHAHTSTDGHKAIVTVPQQTQSSLVPKITSSNKLFHL